MAQDYGVWQLKKFVGKEFMGVIRTTFIINPKGEIAYIWDKVSVRKTKSVKGEKIEILHSVSIVTGKQIGRAHV